MPFKTMLAYREAILLLCCVAAFIQIVAAPDRLVVPAADERPGGKTIRILPLGDSITQGGRRDRPEYSYRYPLYYMLRDAGYDVDFIGSLSTGLHKDAIWPDRNGIAFDPDHEGHYGWTTAQVRDRLANWAAKYVAAPDIVLIHLGSNDYGTNYYGTIVQPLIDIIAILRRANPSVVILVGHLNESGVTPWLIRQLVEGIAYWMSTDTSPVETVDHHKDWRQDADDPDGDTFDGSHPNPKGQAKMAKALFGKMKPHLDRIGKHSVSSTRMGADPSIGADVNRQEFPAGVAEQNPSRCKACKRLSARIHRCAGRSAFAGG
jgi:acyl-CoA thioesterase-1